MKRLIGKLATRVERLHFWYEAGPSGYGLHRLITELGHNCTVVASSHIPSKPYDGVRTSHRVRPRWRGEMSALPIRRYQAEHRKALILKRRRLAPRFFPSASAASPELLSAHPAARQTRCFKVA